MVTPARASANWVEPRNAVRNAIKRQHVAPANASMVVSSCTRQSLTAKKDGVQVHAGGQSLIWSIGGKQVSSAYRPAALLTRANHLHILLWNALWFGKFESKCKILSNFLELKICEMFLVVQNASGNASKAGISSGDTIIYTSSYFGKQQSPPSRKRKSNKWLFESEAGTYDI